MKNEQRRELVKALLACPSIEDRGKRDKVIEELPPGIKHAIDRNNANTFDVMNIVETCANHPDGIEKLLDNLEFYEGKKSIPYQKVRQIWAHISPPGLLPDDQLKTLLMIAPQANITEDDLKKWYRASLPTDFPPQAEAQTLWSMLRHLQYIPPQPNGAVAILMFVEFLAAQTSDGAVANELKTWSEQSAAWLGLVVDDVRAMRDQVAATLQPEAEADSLTATPPFMLIEIRPDATNGRAEKSGLFNVKILLWQPAEALPINLYDDDSPCPLHDVQAIIAQVLMDKAGLFVEDITDLALEFFLPLPLISCDVDQWVKQDFFMNEVKLGEDHLVMIRSWERIRNPSLQAGWRKRWAQFSQTIDPQDIVHYCPKKPYGAKELLNELKAAEKIACLGITFLLADNEQAVLRQMLGAGIPVALWPRGGGSVAPEVLEKIHTKIEAIISSDSLLNLPKAVKQERLKAFAETDLGNHLTLLWDDPERIPPKQHLQFSQGKE